MWGTGSYTTCTSPESYGRTPSRSSGGSANESTGSQPFLVAKLGQGCRRTCEELAKNCTACQAVKKAPIKAPLHPWAWPTAPWQRVHVAFLW